VKRKDFEPAHGRHKRASLLFGTQKLNLRHFSKDGQDRVTDELCFLTETTPENVVNHLKRCGVVIEEGPVETRSANELFGKLVVLYTEVRISDFDFDELLRPFVQPV
jgi:hypothetical protein